MLGNLPKKDSIDLKKISPKLINMFFKINIIDRNFLKVRTFFRKNKLSIYVNL